MRAVVAHPSLNRGGGAERVCLGVVGALRRGGYRVRLSTVDRTDWRFLEGRFGRLPRPDEESYLVDGMPAGGRFSQSFFTVSFFLPELLRLRLRGEGEVVVNTYGDLVDSLSDVSYVNAIPVRLYHRHPGAGFTGSFLWSFFSRAYDISLRPLDRMCRGSALLTNSDFLRGVVREGMGRDSLVVHPPVETGRFRVARGFSERENLVATVSRLRSGKQLELVPRIAGLVKGGRFIIAGLADSASRRAISDLNGEIERLGVGGRVSLLINRSFRELADVLSSSKVYLQTQRLEAFGISVVEAMAAGCVPVVPRDGGPWLDVLGRVEGLYGFSYADPAEAAGKIVALMGDEALWSEVSARASGRARAFDSSVFERKILGVVNCVSSRRIG